MKRKYSVLSAGLLLLVFLIWFGAVSGPAGLLMDLPIFAGGKISKYLMYLIMGVAEMLLVVPLLVYMAITRTNIKALMGNRTNLTQNLLAVALGILLVPAFSGLDGLITWLFRLIGATPTDTSFIEPNNVWQMLAGMVAIGATAGIVEEPIFRGVVQRGLGSALNRRAAIVVTALFFSFVHLDIVGALVRFIIGLILGYMAWRAGALLPGILLHAAFNSTSVGLGLLMKSVLPGWDGFTLIQNASADVNSVLSWLLISIPFALAAWGVYRLFDRASPPSAAWEDKPYVAAGEVRFAHTTPWIVAGAAILVLTGLTALMMWLPNIMNMPDMSQFFK